MLGSSRSKETYFLKTQHRSTKNRQVDNKAKSEIPETTDTINDPIPIFLEIKVPVTKMIKLATELKHVNKNRHENPIESRRKSFCSFISGFCKLLILETDWMG